VTALAAGRPDTHLSVNGWRVDALSARPGLTRLSTSGPDLHIRVGDQVPRRGRAAQPAHLRSMLVADLFADGTVVLVTRLSPPALIVSRDGAALLPADGRASGRTVLEPDDLLVMCSAATLDAHPAGVVDLLKAGPDTVRTGDTEQLVHDLVHGSSGGAAAVVRRLAPVTEALRTG
jgi:hypothetical protein